MPCPHGHPRPLQSCSPCRAAHVAAHPPPEPELELEVAVGDAARPPEPAARPPDRPVIRIGFATVPKADVDVQLRRYVRAVKAIDRNEARRRVAVNALADLGLSVRAIAERVDLDPQTVHRWTRDEG